ncbi:MAG: hypothetical protein JRN58_04850 [Nitrososphaerota archaeon]|nr:hypothetical protein [Nitrososphaerota archaeon]MDG6967443.1 hypothetical protein [Nitrososphaerota archaeon]MDG6978393.1 hypothetical protein [Nitrososphaerota archaeon]
MTLERDTDLPGASGTQGLKAALWKDMGLWGLVALTVFVLAIFARAYRASCRTEGIPQ